MTSQKKLLLYPFLFLVLFSVILIILFLQGVISKQIFISILLAEGIIFFNTLFGFIAIKSGLKKPDKIFFRRVFGGIAARLISTLVLIVLVLLFLELNRISFIFSALFFYVFFLVIEIIYLNFHQN